MADDLTAQFQAASDEVTKLSKAPDNMVKLDLYALYKQATAGDVQGSRPGMIDFVGRAKYDKWAEHKGKTLDEAKQAYISLVEDLKAKDARGEL
jgi:acyl-CoA-binding protein